MDTSLPPSFSVSPWLPSPRQRPRGAGGRGQPAKLSRKAGVRDDNSVATVSVTHAKKPVWEADSYSKEQQSQQVPWKSSRVTPRLDR